MARTTFATLQTQVAERLGETAVRDFWTTAELKEELNAALHQFTNEEKWHWLLTSGTADLDSGDTGFAFPEGVDSGNISSILITPDGTIRPYLLVKVTPEKGFDLRQYYYFSSGYPTWYYLSSVSAGPQNAIIAIVNAGSTAGNFTITYSAQTTGNISRGATAAVIQAALEALSNIDPGDVQVTGGPFGTDTVAIEFTGALAGAPQAITFGGTTTSLTQSDAAVGGLYGGEFIDTIRVIPTPSRDFTVEYLYYADSPELVAAGDVPRVPDQYVDALVSWATYKLWLKELSGGPKAQEQFTLYHQVLAMAITDQRTQSNDDLLVAGKDEPQWQMKDSRTYSQFRMPTTLGG
jgi:hypothetical protein